MLFGEPSLGSPSLTQSRYEQTHEPSRLETCLAKVDDSRSGDNRQARKVTLLSEARYRIEDSK